MPRHPNKLSDEVRARVLELQAAGRPRNHIARELGIGVASVSRIVHAAGRQFDRAATAAATRAKVIDNRARRATISAGLLDDAQRMRTRMFAEHTYVQYGGKDFDRAEDTYDQPIPADQLKLMQAAGIALQRHIDLERHDAEQGADAVRSMLGELGKALGVRAPDA